MMDWQKINSVFLDLDGTLLDLAFDNFFWNEHIPQQWAELNQTTLIQGKKHIQKLTLEYKGRLEWYCLDFWSHTLSLDIPALKYLVRDKIQIRAGVYLFLDWLVKQPVKIFLVTNAHPKTLKIKFEKIPKLQPYFHQIISSHDYGHPKESQIFWKKLKSSHTFDPISTLFIDDSESVLKAAAEYGIQYCLSVAQPDSSQPAHNQSIFPLLHNWKELMNHA